jgi:hypothetical protein
MGALCHDVEMTVRRALRRPVTIVLPVAVAVVLVAGCSDDDGGSRDSQPVDSVLLADLLPPPVDTEASDDTFVERVLADDVVTTDELESAYEGYIRCLVAGGVSGVYSWDISLEVGPVTDGLSIAGDDPEGARLTSVQAGCARDRLDNLTNLHDAANPQDPGDLLARQRESIDDCVTAVNPAVAANLPDDLTVSTVVDGAATIDLQLDPTSLGAQGDEVLPVDRCLGSLGAPYTPFPNE